MIGQFGDVKKVFDIIEIIEMERLQYLQFTTVAKRQHRVMHDGPYSPELK